MSESWDKLQNDLAAMRVRLDELERRVVYPALSRKTDEDLKRGLENAEDEWETYPLGHYDALGSAAERAPSDADYLVKTANGSLSAERVVTDTASLVWDWATAGQAKVNVQFGTSSSTACVGNDSRLPAGQGSAIPNPAGGLTVDVEARAAIVLMLDTARANRPSIAT